MIMIMQKSQIMLTRNMSLRVWGDIYFLKAQVTKRTWLRSDFRQQRTEIKSRLHLWAQDILKWNTLKMQLNTLGIMTNTFHQWAVRARVPLKDRSAFMLAWGLTWNVGSSSNCWLWQSVAHCWARGRSRGQREVDVPMFPHRSASAAARTL